MIEEFSTSDVVHNEVDSIVFLKDVVHLNYEWMLYFEHNQLFKFYFVDSVFGDDVIFFQTFNCKVLIALRKVSQENTSETSF